MNSKQKSVIMSAFRYALGRKTYVVADVIDYIMEHIEDIDTVTKEIMVKEISETTDLGMEMDIARWYALHDALKDSMLRITPQSANPPEGKKNLPAVVFEPLSNPSKAKTAPNKLTADQRHKMVKSYFDGKKSIDLAHEFNITQTSVLYHVNNYKNMMLKAAQKAQKEKKQA